MPTVSTTKPISFEYTLDLGELGFACREGKLVYPIYSFNGGGGGSYINLKLYREAYTTEDDQLVQYLQKSNSQNSFITPGESSVSHQYHVYQRRDSGDL